MAASGVPLRLGFGMGAFLGGGRGPHDIGRLVRVLLDGRRAAGDGWVMPVSLLLTMWSQTNMPSSRAGRSRRDSPRAAWWGSTTTCRRGRRIRWLLGHTRVSCGAHVALASIMCSASKPRWELPAQRERWPYSRGRIMPPTWHGPCSMLKLALANAGEGRSIISALYGPLLRSEPPNTGCLHAFYTLYPRVQRVGHHRSEDEVVHLRGSRRGTSAPP